MRAIIGRAVAAVVISEAAYIVLGLLFSLLTFTDPMNVVASYTRLSPEEWTIRMGVAFGALGVGAFSAIVHAPFRQLVFGMALIPPTDLAVFVLHMDIIATPPAYFVWLIPLCATTAGCLPTIAWLVRARSQNRPSPPS